MWQMVTRSRAAFSLNITDNMVLQHCEQYYCVTGKLWVECSGRSCGISLASPALSREY